MGNLADDAARRIQAEYKGLVHFVDFSRSANSFERDVHAEHSAIYTAAKAGQEARTALALEAHIRLTYDLLAGYAETSMDLSSASSARGPTSVEGSV